MNYYISDIHFYDLRIFNLCNRPFKNIDIFNQYIINKWNSKISYSDDVYIIGDIGSNKVKETINILDKLNGKKHLIVGNRDEDFLKLYEESQIFIEIKYNKQLVDGNRSVFLIHYPLMDWPNINNNCCLIYGHIHNKFINQGNMYKEIKEYYKDKLAYNASCDVIGFIPKTLDELIKLKEANIDEPYIN